MIEFFTPEELRYTFGVTKLDSVPPHSEVFPKFTYHSDGTVDSMSVEVNQKQHTFKLETALEQLLGDHFTVVYRDEKRGGRLLVNPRPSSCHYRFFSNETHGAISNCDGRIVGDPFMRYSNSDPEQS
ncbi:hypothetical protein ANCCAN_14253 [Ancylostoma caninum]|uniref:Peptidase M12B propeptide domain-containing protein n=1 Tax=Ancylostoma caninum TaxID=29170 RepID=A0A368G949_ANCCA|nr:hypothetical protein ANCCAN_14253 [Ancylostoma caninum]